jgi:hypothetical protein
MMLLTRELVAYALIGLTTATALPLYLSHRRRAHRERLRRRGIKTHGH